MSEWVDVAIYTALIVVIWGWLPLWSSRFTVPTLADRNPEWVASHPEEIRKLTSGRGFVWMCRAWGALCVTVLLLLQTQLFPRWLPVPADTSKWEAIKDVNSMLLIAGLVGLVGSMVLVGRWVEKNVPVSARRQATLERRAIADFVPRWFRVLTHALVGLHATAWLTVMVMQLYSTSAFRGRLALALGMPVVFAFMNRLSVNRRPGAMDRIFGPAFRRREVRFGFALQWIVPIAGTVRLYEEVAATRVPDVDRLMHLAMPVLIVVWALRIARLTRPQEPGVASPSARRPSVGLAGAIIAFAALSGSAVLAQASRTQDVTGAWQGTLNVGQELRLVFVIANAEGGGLKATMHSIDQGGGQGISATAALQGTTVRMSIPAIGGTFEGRLSADAASMVGTMSQGGNPLPLTLVRATPTTAWAIPALPTPMAADAPTVFEVATVKPSNPDATGKLFTVRGREVLTINTAVVDLISFAYGVQARQILGGGAWINTERYDVNGLPEAPGIPNERQLRGLMRTLLEDRFRLAMHREMKELPVYAITVGTGGHRLTRNDTNPNGLPSLLFRGLGVLPAVNATIADFAGVLQTAVLDRPVVDKTGLSGRYDFTLTWTPDESQFGALGVRVPPPSGHPNAPPGLFTAIQEQLGLKLGSTSAPVDMLVIDRVEKPSGN